VPFVLITRHEFWLLCSVSCRKRSNRSSETVTGSIFPSASLWGGCAAIASFRRQRVSVDVGWSDSYYARHGRMHMECKSFTRTDAITSKHQWQGWEGDRPYEEAYRGTFEPLPRTPIRRTKTANKAQLPGKSEAMKKDFPGLINPKSRGRRIACPFQHFRFYFLWLIRIKAATQPFYLMSCGTSTVVVPVDLFPALSVTTAVMVYTLPSISAS
jgi:hypothetical protein